MGNRSSRGVKRARELALRRIEERKNRALARHYIHSKTDLAGLPSPVRDLLLGYLDGVDLAHASAVTKSWQNLCGRQMLWKSLGEEKFAVEERGNMESHQSFYRRKYQSERRIELHRAEVNRYAEAKSFARIVNKPIFNFIYFIPVLFFSIILPLKLDGIVDWSWAETFIPIYFIDFLLLLQTLSLMSIFYKCNYIYEDLEGGGCIYEAYGACNGAKPWHIFQIFGCLTFVAFSVLMPLKADDPDSNMSWVAVFTPLFFCWMAATTLGIVAMKRNFGNQTAIFCVIFMAMFSFLALLATWIMVVIHLEFEQGRSMIDVMTDTAFIPLYVANTLAICSPCALYLFSAFDCRCMNDYDGEVDQKFHCLFMICWYIPFLTFEILILNNVLDGDGLAFTRIFICVWVVEGIFGCLLCGFLWESVSK